jgi:hypothetical protein
MRLSYLAVLLGLLAVVACDDLRDVMAVSSAVQERYHMAANVRLNNNSHLAITFQNAPVASMKLDSAGLEEFARGVAAFAKAHYPKAKQLEDVTVAFSTVSDNGPITIERTEAPHRYLASELP